MKTALIVDSVGYLSDELNSLTNVYTIDLTVNFSDGTVINDTCAPAQLKSFYDRLSKENQLPTTSQPQVGKYYELLNQLVAEGYQTVFCIHLSAGISGTYQTAVMVTSEYQDKIQAYCIDSKGASVTMEGLVRAALKMIDQGEDSSLIANKLNWLANESRIYLMVEDLTNLVKGGRLSATSALLGGVLQIRPLLYFDQAGKIVLFEKIRTNKRVFKRWSELVQEAIEKYPKGISIAFAHADVYDEIKKVEMQIVAEHPGITSSVSALGPVVGTHTGRGTKGIAIIPHIDNYF